jgi:hypothetical protein
MSDDELLEALEDELEADSDFMSSYREQRLAEYKREWVARRPRPTSTSWLARTRSVHARIRDSKG